MSLLSESINLKNSNVMDSDSSIDNSLTADLHQNLKNVMANGALFTEDQSGGAGRKKKSGSKKSKRAGSKRGSKKTGSKKAGSKKGSKRPGSKKGSKKAGSKKAGSKKGSKRPGSKKGSKKAGSKKAGSKSKRLQTAQVDLEQSGAGRKKKGGKKSSRSRSLTPVVNNLSDSIDNTASEFQQGGKKKKATSPKRSSSSKRSSKGSKPKRELPEKLKEFQRLVKHMASGLGHSPTLFSLAKSVRDDASKANPNATPKQLTDASIKLFDSNKGKYTKELESLKAAKAKAKAAKN